MKHYIIDNNGWILSEYQCNIEAFNAYRDYFHIWTDMYPDCEIDCSLACFVSEIPLQASNGKRYFPSFR